MYFSYFGLVAAETLPGREFVIASVIKKYSNGKFMSVELQVIQPVYAVQYAPIRRKT